MARKKEEPNYIEELAERFGRWDEIYQNGCHDPSWSDGVNPAECKTDAVCI